MMFSGLGITPFCFSHKSVNSVPAPNVAEEIPFDVLKYSWSKNLPIDEGLNDVMYLHNPTATELQYEKELKVAIFYGHGAKKRLPLNKRFLPYRTFDRIWSPEIKINGGTPNTPVSVNIDDFTPRSQSRSSVDVRPPNGNGTKFFSEDVVPEKVVNLSHNNTDIIEQILNGKTNFILDLESKHPHPGLKVLCENLTTRLDDIVIETYNTKDASAKKGQNKYPYLYKVILGLCKMIFLVKQHYIDIEKSDRKSIQSILKRELDQGCTGENLVAVFQKVFSELFSRKKIPKAVYNSIITCPPVYNLRHFCKHICQS
jgi:hypothetical protein